MDSEEQNSQLPDSGPPGQGDVAPEAEHFYSGAAGRITRHMLVLALLGVVVTGWRMGIWFAAGFSAGCSIAYINFCWLKKAVNALAERATGGGCNTGGRGVFIRFLLRYGLIAIVAYAIFEFSTQGLYGMLTGLFLPVGAIACEAAYEAYVALRRGL